MRASGSPRGTDTHYVHSLCHSMLCVVHVLYIYIYIHITYTDVLYAIILRYIRYIIC